MAILVNDKDIALQASPYRDKTTLVDVTSTVSNFTVAKNGGPVSPASTIVTAVPNIVFTAAAIYTWDYALNTSPTLFKGFVGGLLPETSFSKTGVSINGTGSYNNITGTTLSGVGTGAVFNISKGVSGTTYGSITITVVNGGTGYQPQDRILIPGTSLGYAAGDLSTVTNTGFSKSGTTSTSTVSVTYTGVTQKSTSGSGTGAVFSITKPANTSNSYSAITVAVTTVGGGYANGDTIVIAGTSLGSPNVTGALKTAALVGAANKQTFAISGTCITTAISTKTFTSSQFTTTGVGTGATITVSKTTAAGTSYSTSNTTVNVTVAGSGYAVGDYIYIPGGASGLGTNQGQLTLQVTGSVYTPTTNDLVLTITGTPSSATKNDLTLTVGSPVFSLVGPTQTITNTTIKGIIGTSNASSITFRCTVTEPLLDDATGEVVVAYTQEQANSDAISIELSKVSSTVSLSALGVGSYSGTGTTITVTRAGSGLVYDANGGSAVTVATPNSFKVEIVQDSAVDLTVPLRTIGTFSNTLNTFVFDGISALTADYATVTFRVIVYDASGNKTQTTYKQLQYSRVASGITGADAVVYYLDTSAPVLVKGSSSASEVGEFVQISISGKRTAGGITTSHGFITLTGDGDSESAVATSVVSGPYTTNILNSSNKSKYTVKLYSAASVTDVNTVLLDSQAIPVVFTGGNAIIGSLSNDNATIPLEPGNLVPAGGYDNTATFIRVFDGATELTYRTGTSTTLVSSWVITSTTLSSDLSIGTITAVAKSAYLSKLVSLGVNSGTIQFNIAGVNGAGKAFTLTLVQSISKTFPGVDATLSYLEIPTGIISKSTESVTTDGVHSSITITGKSTIGNAVPTNSGFITVSPKVKVTGFLSNNGIYCTGVSAFTVNDPIVFSGIGLPTNIAAGTEYFIKTIDLVNRFITISTAAPAGIAGTTVTFTNGSLQALTNGIISTTGLTISGTALTATFTAKTGLTQKSTTGSGKGAVFTITKSITGTAYSGRITVTVTTSGRGYSIGDSIVIDGAALGGASVTNDLTLVLTGTTSVQKIDLTQAYGHSEKRTATALTITPSVPNDAGIYSLIAKMYSAADRYATTSVLDSQEMLVLFKGSNAVTAILDNDSVGIPFNTALNGTISSATGAYDKSGTSISVYEGTTELTYDGSGTSPGTYNVTASSPGTAITPGAISVSGVKALAANANSLSAATASIIFTITGKTIGGAALPTINKTQTFSRNASGQPGANGVSQKVAVVTAHAWTTTGSPPTISGTFNYTWATGALSNSAGTQTSGANIGYPTGWTALATGAETAGNGATLYQIAITITDATTATITSGLKWTDAKLARMGYRQDGTIGFTGDSSRIAYTKQTLTAGSTVSSMTPPAAPVGNSLPITSGAYTWQATPPTIVAGEIMYQSDGVYVATSATAGTITWAAPYLSTFKVGTLSAITANLGFITGGSLSIGPSGEPARFTVSTEGAVVIKSAGTSYMQITNDAVKVFDASGLRLQLGNLDV